MGAPGGLIEDIAVRSGTHPMDRHQSFIHRICRMAYHLELAQARALGHHALECYISASDAAQATHEMLMADDRPLVLTRFRR